MTGSPAWMEQALCRQRRLPVEWFIPVEGQRPNDEAVATCKACPAGGLDGPCAADRKGDVGQRGDGFVGGRGGRHLRQCERCGTSWAAPGGKYRWCPPCSAARRRGAA